MLIYNMNSNNFVETCRFLTNFVFAILFNSKYIELLGILSLTEIPIVREIVLSAYVCCRVVV